MTDTHPWIKNYPQGITWDMDVPSSTMVHLFEESVTRFADKTCLNFYGHKWTYKQVGEMARWFAAGLQSYGISKGAKVGLCLPNTPFYPIAYYGSLMAGAVIVNFNPLYGEQELEHQIKDGDCDVMVTANLAQIYPHVEKMLDRTDLRRLIVCDFTAALPPQKGIPVRIIDKLRRFAATTLGQKIMGADRAKKFTVKLNKTGAPPLSTPRKDGRILYFADFMKAKGFYRHVDIKPDDLAVLQYTGGTTGVPKGAALSHENLTVNVAQSNLWFNAGKKSNEHEKVLVVLPFFHVFSMTVQLNLSLSRGAEICMLPKFDLYETLDFITKQKPSMFAGVPTLYKAIIDCKSIGKYNLSSLKFCLSGGAALTTPIMDGFKKLTGLELVEGYGLSETSPLATANPVHGVKKVGSVGMPVPQTKIKIQPLENAGADAPGHNSAGLKEGEICLGGPQVMTSYWNNPAETAKVMDAEGYFHTGDVGYVDEDGYLFIVDRIKDMINASGFKVFSSKVEKAILQHPDISEAIVIGVPDDYRGETVKAFIVMKPGAAALTRTSLNDFLADKLAPYELPKTFDLRDALPKTVIGKPDKKALIAEEKKKAAATPAA